VGVKRGLQRGLPDGGESHYACDKAALLAALSAAIFAGFGAALRTVWETTPGTAKARPTTVSRACFHFSSAP